MGGVLGPSSTGELMPDLACNASVRHVAVLWGLGIPGFVIYSQGSFRSDSPGFYDGLYEEDMSSSLDGGIFLDPDGILWRWAGQRCQGAFFESHSTQRNSDPAKWPSAPVRTLGSPSA